MNLTEPAIACGTFVAGELDARRLPLQRGSRLMRMRGARVVGVLVLLVVLSRPASLAAAPPRTIDVGGTPLTLQGQGTRSKLGVIDLYSVALYLPQRYSDVRRIWDSDVPKGLIVEILYNGSMPDKVPKSWSNELLPGLTFEQKHAVADAWANLSTGDTIRLTYAPGSGTSLRLGEREVLRDGDDAIMRSFLDVWVGRSPVSKELRGSLLGH
jgi:hypothetical protein